MMDKIDKALASVCSPLFNDWKIRAKLNPDEATVFYMREFENKTVSQISYDINYSESSVKRIYKRARAKIIKIL